MLANVDLNLKFRICKIANIYEHTPTFMKYRISYVWDAQNPEKQKHSATGSESC